MGRLSTIDLLPRPQKLFVESTIRTHRYHQIDCVQALIKEAGIVVSRSALHRYFQKLADRDARHRGNPDDLVIILVERSTGSTTTLTTAVCKRVVVEAIERLTAPVQAFHRP